MITKTYHIMDYGDWKKLIPWFHPAFGSHYLVLPHSTLTPEDWHELVHKGTEPHFPPDHARILVAAAVKDEGALEHITNPANHRNLVSLPHPVFEATDKLKPHHVEELHHLFCGRNHLYDEFPNQGAKKAAAAQADVREIIRRATARHPLMRLSVF